MKNIALKMTALAMAISVFTSCSDDDDAAGKDLTGENSVSLEFDNSMNGDDLLLGALITPKFLAVNPT